MCMSMCKGVWRRVCGGVHLCAGVCMCVHAWGVHIQGCACVVVHRGMHARMWVHVWSERNGSRGIFQILALFTRASQVQ